MNLLRLALRNLKRNQRRSVIALATIVFAVIALLLAGGFIEWIFWAMRTAAIQPRLGHIQIMKPGYLEAGIADPFAYLLPDDSEVPKTVEKATGVYFVTPRIAFNGLISFGENSVSFMGEGVDPKREAAVSSHLVITEGKALSGDAEDEVFIGRGLAEIVGAKTGDTVTLLANTSTGGINAVEARVSGLFYTSTQAIDDAALRVPISLARKLIRASGMHTWVVFLEETELTNAVLNELKSKYRESSSELQFIPWYALAEFYNKTVVLFSRQMGVVRLIVALIIVLSISNMLVMTVLERKGEIGTLLAIGQRRRSIMMLFLSEGLLLGTIGGGLGLAAGVLLAQAISAIGIPMPPPPGMDEGFTGEILITWPLALGSFLLAISTTTLSAVYPSWKASRLQIVDALRHNT